MAEFNLTFDKAMKQAFEGNMVQFEGWYDHMSYVKVEKDFLYFFHYNLDKEISSGHYAPCRLEYEGKWRAIVTYAYSCGDAISGVMQGGRIQCENWGEDYAALDLETKEVTLYYVENGKVISSKPFTLTQREYRLNWRIF